MFKKTKQPLEGENVSSVDPRIQEAAKIDSQLDKEFIEEYNKLTIKYKRTFVGGIQLQRLNK